MFSSKFQMSISTKKQLTHYEYTSCGNKIQSLLYELKTKEIHSKVSIKFPFLEFVV
jgi:hypothetical protein